MSMFRRLNPFRRRCCEVPLVVGDIDTARSVVHGIAEVDDAYIVWVGIVQDPNEVDHQADEALEVAERVLSERMRVSGA